jgi:hypothetical protein
MAKDLRIRFEFGNVSTPDVLNIPVSKNEPFSMIIDDLKFDFQMFIAEYEGLKGYWEKGGNEKASWIDFVFYSGIEKDFDLTKITKAVSGFTFSIDTADKNQVLEKAIVSEKDGQMDVIWKGLKIQIPVKPILPKNTFI